MKRAALLIVACVLAAQAQDHVADWEEHFTIAKNAAQDSDSQAALAAYETALKKAEVFGPDDRRLGTTLNSFAAFCLRSKLYSRAEPLFARAVAVYERIYGVSHKETLRVTKNLATLYLATDNLAKAQRLFEQIVAEEGKKLDKNDPDLAESYLGLAMLEQKKGRTFAAESAYRQVLRITKEAFSERDDSYITAFRLVTGMYNSEILMLAGKAQRVGHGAAVNSTWRLVALFDRQAALYADYGNGKEGEEIVRKSVLLRENIMGINSPAVCLNLGYLAALLRKQGRYGEAFDTLTRALTITDREQDLHGTARIWILVEMARLAEAQGDAATVERYFDTILEIERESWGETHPKIVSRLEEAIEFMERLGGTQSQSKFVADLAATKALREQSNPVYSTSQDGVTAPRLQKSPKPAYSDEAQKKRYEPTIILEVDINAEGRPENINIYRYAGHGLDKLAVNAVRKWRFTPGHLDARPVAVHATVQVNFRLQER